MNRDGNTSAFIMDFSSGEKHPNLLIDFAIRHGLKIRESTLALLINAWWMWLFNFPGKKWTVLVGADALRGWGCKTLSFDICQSYTSSEAC